MSAPAVTIHNLKTQTFGTIAYMSDQDLQNIIDTAPENAKKSIGTISTRNDKIVAVLRIQMELPAHTPQLGKEALRDIINMSFNTLHSLSKSNLSHLLQLMKAAKAYKPSLPDFDPKDSAKDLLLKALQWKLLYSAELPATETSPTQRQDDSLPNFIHAADPLHPPPTSNSPGNLPASDQYFANLAWQSPTGPPSKQMTTAKVVPIVDEHGIDTTNPPVKLGPYPGHGLSLPTLSVSELWGGRILQALVRRGENVEQAVSRMSWPRGANDEVLASEAEAYTLARILNLCVLQHKDMQHALDSCVWMEVALRRLYALIFVEDAIRTKSATRAMAWRTASSILEVYPVSHSLLPELENRLNSQFVLEAELTNAFRTTRTKQNNQRTPKKRVRSSRFPPSNDRN